MEQVILTAREKEVLKRICLNDKDIAKQLQIAPTTVKTYVANLRNKFVVESKILLLYEALKGGYIKVEEIITKQGAKWKNKK